MAIPDFQTLMLPVLRAYKDGEWRHNKEVVNRLADEFSVTEEERNALTPKGKQRVFYNRVIWAQIHLEQAGLLERKKDGLAKITDTGLQELNNPIEKIDVKYLMRFPAFLESRKSKNTRDNLSKLDQTSEKTPEELIETGFEKIIKDVASELLKRIKACSPEFFERLVVQLLLKMGYGGSREDAGRRIGGSGDGGVDGIINEDKLGLDVIYIQAKKWENVVSRPEIQKFVGALQGKRAKKGVFITTSSFSSEARAYVENIENRVVLIDGEQMAQFMIDHNVGVSTVDTYEIKKIDSDFFSDE